MTLLPDIEKRPDDAHGRRLVGWTIRRKELSVMLAASAAQ